MRASLVSGLVLALMMVAVETLAQETAAIDHDHGRDIINDPWRAMATDLLAVDHEHGILYVHDLEERDGVMAFSLTAGERLSTYQVRKGDGPQELRAIRGITVASGGRLYLWDSRKVLELDTAGAIVSYWHPETRIWSDVCDFEGEPAVPDQRSVIRRSVGEGDERIGLEESDEYAARVRALDRVTARNRAEALASISAMPLSRRLTCAEDAAYVLEDSEEAPDSVFVYDREGMRRGYQVPEELDDRLVDGRPAVLDLTDDGRGNLLVRGVDDGAEVPAVLLDPESGCYTLLRNPPYWHPRSFVGIYADSAMVAHFDHDVEERDGDTIIHLTDRAYRLSLHPLRPTHGQPCPRLLPSVR